MFRRSLAVTALALVLSLGAAGSALAAPPPVATDPAFPAVVPSVPTDPVKSPLSLWQYLSLRTLAPFAVALNGPRQPAVETTGSELVGTYVGSSGAVRYIPAFQYQLIYSDPQGGYNCTAYSMAMAIDKATYGGDRVSGSQIRALSPAYPYIGLTLPDAITAASRTHVRIYNKSGQTWGAMIDALRHGRGVILQGNYGQMGIYSAQPSFRGNHAVYIDYLHSSGNYLYVMDPLSKVGGRWIPVSVMRAYAEKLGRSTGIYPGIYWASTAATRLFR